MRSPGLHLRIAPQYSRASEFIFNAVHDVLTRKRDPQAVLDALEVDLEDRSPQNKRGRDHVSTEL